MLDRSTTIPLTQMSSAEFLRLVMRTSIGREVNALREQDLRERRRASAKVLDEVAARDRVLEKLDDDVAAAKARIDDLAKQLRVAQEHHFELRDQKAAEETARHQLDQRARGFLNATAPAALITVEMLAKRAERSAKFQGKNAVKWSVEKAHLRPASMESRDPDAAVKTARGEGRKAQRDADALLQRAQSVLRQVRSMILDPDADGAAAERLMRELSMPAELIEPDERDFISGGSGS